ncbi:agmatinase [Rhodobacteraceae bacterium B1Z28]|uniref:Agmatinase n=1 Tax=Ruegeria haliotis TaxID=2747601 RepID=A0ABX2PUC6_9RHOB|nr:agmatinase [Ruegeria haliotis]NVO56976.1 agmatinase [Ruegeria haliotis]
MSEQFSFEPVSASEVPRFAGHPTFMRLPAIGVDEERISQVDIGFVGVPWDGGTTNRPGARHGPRQLRDYSTMIRAMHPVSKVRPFSMVNCADLGDSPVNPADLMDTMERVTGCYRQLRDFGITPMTAGGDHLISLPILRALAEKSPLSMIHFDAHTDLFDEYFGGCKITHGTPFRRAIEEGLLDPKRVIQIGIRGTTYDEADVEWGLEQGVRIITIEEVLDRGIGDVMTEARRIVGDTRTYVSFDIDCIDPSFAPGTGTPEIGGFSTREAQQLVRGLTGVNIAGADLVEVSPPFDPSGGTAWVGVSVMFEILCAMAPSVANRKTRA